MRFSTINIGGFLFSAGVLSAALQDFDLETTTGSGGIYLTNVNNESVEPNTTGGKSFDYPYYFDPVQNLWVMVVSEKLDASYTYVYEEANYSVLNKTVSATNPGSFSFGSVSWDDNLLTGSGSETLGSSDFTLAFDGGAFSPLNSPRNVNNEFAWDYAVSVTALTLAQLSFFNGVLTGVDVTADIDVTPQFLGNPALAFGSPYSGTVTISGSSFSFAVDVIQDNTSFLGNLTDTHMVFDAAGTLTGVVPEPAAGTFLVATTSALTLLRRRRNR